MGVIDRTPFIQIIKIFILHPQKFEEGLTIKFSKMEDFLCHKIHSTMFPDAVSSVLALAFAKQPLKTEKIQKTQVKRFRSSTQISSYSTTIFRRQVGIKTLIILYQAAWYLKRPFVLNYIKQSQLERKKEMSVMTCERIQNLQKQIISQYLSQNNTLLLPSKLDLVDQKAWNHRIFKSVDPSVLNILCKEMPVGQRVRSADANQEDSIIKAFVYTLLMSIYREASISSKTKLFSNVNLVSLNKLRDHLFSENTELPVIEMSNLKVYQTEQRRAIVGQFLNLIDNVQRNAKNESQVFNCIEWVLNRNEDLFQIFNIMTLQVIGKIYGDSANYETLKQKPELLIPLFFQYFGLKSQNQNGFIVLYEVGFFVSAIQSNLVFGEYNSQCLRNDEESESVYEELREQFGRIFEDEEEQSQNQSFYTLGTKDNLSVSTADIRFCNCHENKVSKNMFYSRIINVTYQPSKPSSNFLSVSNYKLNLFDLNTSTNLLNQPKSAKFHLSQASQAREDKIPAFIKFKKSIGFQSNASNQSKKQSQEPKEEIQEMLKNYSQSKLSLNISSLETPKSILHCKNYQINPEVQEKADFSHIRAQSFVGRKLSCNIQNTEGFKLPNRVQASTPVSPTEFKRMTIKDKNSFLNYKMKASQKSVNFTKLKATKGIKTQLNQKVALNLSSAKSRIHA